MIFYIAASMLSIIMALLMGFTLSPLMIGVLLGAYALLSRKIMTGQNVAKQTRILIAIGWCTIVCMIITAGVVRLTRPIHEPNHVRDGIFQTYILR